MPRNKSFVLSWFKLFGKYLVHLDDLVMSVNLSVKDENCTGNCTPLIESENISIPTTVFS